MRVTISDAVYQQLELRAAQDRMDVDPWIEEQLVRLGPLASVHDRVLVVGAAARDALEALLGGGSLLTDAALVERVRRLAVLEIGTLHTTFTPGQWEELQRRCERLNLSMEREAQRIVTKVSELFFDHVGV
jgi:hypothetical protein